MWPRSLSACSAAAGHRIRETTDFRNDVPDEEVGEGELARCETASRKGGINDWLRMRNLHRILVYT